jgi:hypothetical protein
MRFLCSSCWALCELPDPADRCRHCFEELDQRGNLCSLCRDKPILNAVRATVFDSESPGRYLGLDSPDAMAGFALLQWIQLEWPMPYAIVPMPDPESQAVAKAFAALLDLPYIQALQGDGEYREGRLEEDEYLLLIDVSSSVAKLKKATDSLVGAFPKRIFLLTLFPYAFCLP